MFGDQLISGLKDPKACTCQVMQYTMGHGSLIILVTEGDFFKGSRKYLSFGGVIYFSGPMIWKWAIFHKIAVKESSPLLKSLDVVPAVNDSMPTSGYSVYEFESPTHEIRVAALGLSILNEPPGTAAGRT